MNLYLTRILQAVFAALLVCCITLVVSIWLGIIPNIVGLDVLSPQKRFVKKWVSSLKSCPDFSSAQALVHQNKEGGQAFLMDDGSWVAVVMEHSCCTGSGFDATIYVSSSKVAHVDTQTNHCSWEPLGKEIHQLPHQSATAFFRALESSAIPLTTPR